MSNVKTMLVIFSLGELYDVNISIEEKLRFKMQCFRTKLLLLLEYASSARKYSSPGSIKNCNKSFILDKVFFLQRLS